MSAIARDLEVWSDGDEPADERLARGVAVGGGTAGQALFHGYLFKANGAERHASRAEQLLEESIEALATIPMHPALYSGFTGIAWTAEHLGRLLGEEEEQTGGGEDEDRSEEIDQALLSALAHSPWVGDYDLLYNRIYQPEVVSCSRTPRACGTGWDSRCASRRGGIAGFETWAPGSDRPLGWGADPGFLTGASGVGLALLAAVTSIQPEWDRLLLVSIPPQESIGDPN